MTSSKRLKAYARDSFAPKPLTAREKIASIPMASPDDPIFKTGFVIGATRLRNASPKKKGGS